MFTFEKLDVWQKAVAYAGSIYRTSKRFPKAEQFGLTSQIRRAGTSIASNIAEGSARSRPDFAKFLGYATGSLYEVTTQATIARNEGFMGDAEYQVLYADAEEISRMLSGLRKSLGD